MIHLESVHVRTYRRRQNRKGAMLILFAVMLILLIVAVVFSVDVAFMQLTRTELRSATDAACRAATEALSRTQDPDEAVAAAKLYASKNLVSSSPLVLTDDDIVLGRSNRQTDGSISFTAGQTPFNTIQIRGRRTADSPNGDVPLFFGRLLGVSSFEPLHVSRAMNLDRDISLVVDRSGSMKQLVSGAGMPPGKSACDPPDPSLSRWGALNVAVQSFISALNLTPQDEQLALASYSSAGTFCDVTFDEADIRAPLSSDYSATQGQMNHLSSVPINGFTNIDEGIQKGIQTLTDPTRTRPLAEKTMVLLSDGLANRGRNPKFAAEEAKAANIVIHTISFGDDADKSKMQEVADITGGNSYHAPDAASLEAIFREIALTLPVLMTE